MAKTIIIETAKAFDAEQALNGASIGFVKDNKGGDKVTLVQYISNFTLKKRSRTNEIYYTGIGSEDGVTYTFDTTGKASNEKQLFMLISDIFISFKDCSHIFWLNLGNCLITSSLILETRFCECVFRYCSSFICDKGKSFLINHKDNSL